MVKVNPEFIKKLEKYGVPIATACFSCGNCSAICPLSYDTFPRKIIRYIQLGLEDRILSNAKELWLCLHCGLCSETCFRQADPAKIIHALRRYVLAKWRGEE
ncbi:4Fe-4S ferredoxin [Candidatus Woesearchaeota archaeon]|nr:MAG: 4Fe-4S ferredoxin [Candidatus Woesearchaeota archaeon]